MTVKGEVSNLAKFTNLKEAPDLLRLMASLDALRASFRWFKTIKKDNTPLGMQDQLFAMVMMMGWTAEAIFLIREGKKNGWLTESLLHGKPECLSLWKEIHASPLGPEIKKIFRARDKYFAHPDRQIQEEFLKSLSNEKYPVSFVETPDDGKFLNTRCPMVYEAIAGDILKAKPGDTYNPDKVEQWKDLIKNMNRIVTGTTRLVAELGVGFLAKHDIFLIEAPEK